MLIGIIVFVFLIFIETGIEALYLDLKYRINRHNASSAPCFIDYPYRLVDTYHTLFVLFRVVAGLTACIFYLIGQGLAFIILYALCLALLFIFMQGFLYLFRNRLNPGVYPKGFWSDPSKSSTSDFNFNKNFRIVSGLIAIIGFIIIAILI